MIVCKTCGFDNESGAQFCGSCGSFLEWTGESTEPAPAAPTTQASPSADVPAPDSSATSEPGPTPVPEPVPDGVSCPNCGTVNERDRVYCRLCATELAPTTVVAAPAVAATGQGNGRFLPAIVGGILIAVVAVGAIIFLGGALGDSKDVAHATPSPTAAASAQTSSSPAIEPSPTPSTPTPTATARPDPTGTIAWSSGSVGEFEIVTSKPDGSKIVHVFEIAGDDIQPTWSPDGKRIAFASAKGIRVVDAKDGGNAVRFSHHNELDRSPEFAPDGKVIAFASSREGDFEIYLRDVGGTNLINLTDDPGVDDSPDWSPETDLIVFSSDRAGDLDIWSMRSNGKRPTQLTGAEGSDDHPVWSPDGSTIAFTSDRDGGRFVYLMDADGSNVRRLTASDDTERYATWSPDGLYVAFRVGSNEDSKIAVVSVEDGLEVTSFAENGKSAAYPSWR